MRKWLFLITPIILLVCACNNTPIDPAKNAPPVKLAIRSFADDFFSMDTIHIANAISGLQKKYPSFSNDYFTYILMSHPQKDTASIKAFLKAYLPVYKAAKKTNAIQIAKPALEEAFKRVHYYFPNYALPSDVILFIGPLETYGNVVTKDGVAIGLQMYLGAQSDWYFSEQIQTIYPRYISRRFTPEYIAVNSIQNIINDIVPIQETGENLLHQMIEQGKRQYITNQCFPNTADSIRTGFTQNQLVHLAQSESDMWHFLLQQNALFSKTPADINAWMQEAPYSDLFGEQIPGNAGKYIGYKIVCAWMSNKAQQKISDDILLHTPAQKIFEEAKYQP